MNRPDLPEYQRARRVTIIDVAKHAGVSTAAVSKTLRNAYGVSEQMKERVQRSMDELGYRPHRTARGMRGRTYTVGMVVSDIENPFFNLLSSGAKSVLGPNGYELLISPGGFSAEDQLAAMDALIDHQMDGMILVSPFVTREELERIADLVPVVTVGHHSVSSKLDSVAGDDLQGAALLVDHLVELGHTRIGFVASRTAPADPVRAENVRLAGFLQAMARHGLSDSAVVLSSEWSMEGGARAARAASALTPRVTAVLAGADVVAFGMMDAWWQDGVRIPDDCSLAGYDNSHVSALGPVSMTTVDQSGFAMGERVGELLLERIAGRIEAVHEIVDPRLVARATTSAPR